MNKSLESPIRELPLNKATEEIRNIFKQIVNIISGFNSQEIEEDVVSIRYLLRKDYFIPYCQLIRSTPQGLERCVCPSSYEELINRVKTTHKPCYTFCHAGLVDFAFPLRTKKRSIVVIGGQFLFNPLTPESTPTFLDKVNNLPLDKARLKEEITSIPVIPFETINSIVALITMILEKIPEMNALDILSKISTPPKSRFHLIQNAIDFLNQNYYKDHSLSEISRELGISSFYLSHIFSEELNTSVIKYRNQLRLKAAKDLLINTPKPITQIAYDLGWNDSNYFSNVFKKNTGQSPRSFRRAHKK